MSSDKVFDINFHAVKQVGKEAEAVVSSVHYLCSRLFNTCQLHK